MKRPVKVLSNKSTIRLLNIFLLKATVDNPKDIIKDKYTLKTKKLSSSSVVSGTFYWYQAGGKNPPWLKTVEKIDPKLGDLQIINSHGAGVLVCKVDGRFFVLCFGYGRHLLKDGIAESNFGLKVTLNAVSSLKLKAIDSSVLETTVIQTRRQASSLSSLDSFGINVERDLCRAVTGSPDNEKLAQQFSGSDSLVAHVDIRPIELEGFLKKILRLYRSKKYLRNFSWVDNIKNITDKKEIKYLNNQLVESINTGNFDKVRISPPSIIDFSKISGFSFHREALPQIELSFLDYMVARPKIKEFSLTSLKSGRLYVHDQELGQIVSSYSVYSSLVWEFQEKKSHFILFSGNWYRISEDFFKRVNRSVRKIETISLSLPNAKNSDSEGKYLKRVSKKTKGFFLYDRKLIRPTNAHTSIEFCDLFSIKKQIIHAKRGANRSSMLSHLFAQGHVSAQAFLSDEEFRKKIIQKYDKVDKYIKQKNVNAAEYSLVFAIITEDDREFEKSLPFFSQVNLASVSRSLRALNIRVQLARISVDS